MNRKRRLDSSEFPEGRKIDYSLSTASDILYKSLTVESKKQKSTTVIKKSTGLRVLREGQLFLTWRKIL